MLWEYNTETRTVEQRHTKDAGYVRDLYAMGLNGENPDFESIEIEMGKIEDVGSRSIQQLLQRKHLSSRSWISFIQFVAVLYHRTPTFFERIRDVVLPSLEESFRRMAKSEEFRSKFQRGLLSEGKSEERIADALVELDQGKGTLLPRKEFLIYLALKSVNSTAEELVKMKWGFLEIPDGDPDLVIGDHTVTLSDVGPDDEPPGPLGLKNPNIELALPIGRRMVAIARWKGKSSYGKLMPGSVDVINDRSFCYARKFVFAHAKSDAILARSIELRGKGPQVNVTKFRDEAGCTVIVNEFH
jgi:hypothetical protein